MTEKIHLSDADKKKLELASSTISTYMEQTKQFGGAASVSEIAEYTGNTKCADCNSEDNQWVSLKIGTFICTKCAEAHRSLKDEYEQIQSFKSDTDMWELKTIQYLESVGNLIANENYESNKPSYYLNSDEMPNCIVIRENYISKKYKEKAFAKEEYQIKDSDKVLEPFYTMPQKCLFEEISVKMPNSKKYVTYWAEFITSNILLYKKENDWKVKAKIDISNTKIVPTKKIEKQISFYYIDILLTSGNTYSICLINRNSDIIKWVHYLRRASIYYTKINNKSKSIEEIKYTTVSQEIMTNGKKSGQLKINNIKVWAVLHDNIIYYFTKPKTLKVKGAMQLYDACIKKIEGKKNINQFVVSNSLGKMIIKTKNSEEFNEWFKSIQENIDDISKTEVLNFKDDYVYVR